MSEILGIAVPTAVLTAVMTGFVNWGTLKATVNGLVPRVESIEKKIDIVAEDVAFLKGMHSLDEPPDSP